MSQQDAKNYALWLLGAREHSSKELQQKLARKGYEQQAIDDAIQYLMDLNYLSDERYAEAFSRSKAAKPLGKQRILNELRMKGIPEQMAKQALNSLEVDWFELALELKQRKFGYTVEKDFKARAKQTRYLVYRGFSFDEVKYATEWSEED